MEKKYKKCILFVKTVIFGLKKAIKRLFVTKTVNLMPVGVNTAEPKPILSKEEFKRALPIVIAKKFDPLIVYTHAYHETGGFKKLIGKYNYFGLKSPRFLLPSETEGWKGKTVAVTTHEVIKGTRRRVIDLFCDFDNAEDCLRFYCFQIKRLYKDSYENRQWFTAYFYWLTRGKNQFATDLGYSEKLENLYKQLKQQKELKEYEL